MLKTYQSATKLKNLKFAINLSKWNKTTINLSCVCERTYTDNRFLAYAQKRLQKLANTIFKNVLLVVEPVFTKKMDNKISIDITIPTPEHMDTRAKRKWAYDPDGKVFQLCDLINDQIDDIFDGFGQYSRREKEKIKCGEHLYLNYDE